MLRNKNIGLMEHDHLYHFALNNKDHDLKTMFGDVKFVLVGGSPRRMERTAHFLVEELKMALPTGYDLTNIASATDRYALYKVGPVLLASHGMGMPSASIMLHEMIKLVYHAGCIQDVIFIRIGTCGGLGLEPGSLVVSEAAVNGILEPYQEMAILGKKVRRPAIMDKDLACELQSLQLPEDDFKVVLGKTMCTDDFYEGQGRLDGAICEFTEADKMAFLREACNKGVRNIEMESLCFAAMCHHTGIKTTIVCTAMVNRLKGDRATTSREKLTEWEENPARLVSSYIFRFSSVYTNNGPYLDLSAVVCVAIVNRFNGDQVTTSKETLTEWEWNPARLVSRLIKRKLDTQQ